MLRFSRLKCTQVRFLLHGLPNSFKQGIKNPQCFIITVPGWVTERQARTDTDRTGQNAQG